MPWNGAVHRGTIANEAIVRERDGAGEAVAEGVHGAATDEYGAKGPLRLRSSKDGPAVVASAAPFPDAFLESDSSLKRKN